MSPKTPVVTAPPAPQPVQTRAPDEDVDYQTLLLALADEYLNAAHGKGTSLALTKDSADLADYYKLVATGLGCLEAAQVVRISCLSWLNLTKMVDTELSITAPHRGIDAPSICSDPH